MYGHTPALPKWAEELPPVAQSKKRGFRSRFLRRFLFSVTFIVFALRILDSQQRSSRLQVLEHGLEQCSYITSKPGPSPNFHARTTSDRFEPGTRSVWIRNATLWTGERGSDETYLGDLLLEGGVLRYVGPPRDLLDIQPLLRTTESLQEVNAERRWVTPGIVDAHSHAGEEGGNSIVNDIHPYLRVLDVVDFTTPDYKLITAGGVTTSLLLPGSAVGIGGQAFVAKFRPTAINTPTAKLVEPPYEWVPGRNMSGKRIPAHWRHMKHALGENPNGVFGIVRMDNIWEMRKAYSAAQEWQIKQNEWCGDALQARSTWNLKSLMLGEEGNWPWGKERGPFPKAPLEHEALLEVLNGKVKLNVHSYEVMDFDALVRMSNEFGFEVAGIHHAHEAWLAPELLKGMYKHPPAVCIFSSFSMYKQESYRWSPFAPRILSDAGLEVVMKSDHSGVVARYLPREAAIAHQWGLDEETAMRSITTHPAKAIGLDHRVGYLRKGYDADVVIWQGHPLAAGSAPLQVYVDGIPQIEDPVTQTHSSGSSAPATGRFDKEIEYEIGTKGTPDLSPREFYDNVLFRNVKHVWLRRNGTVKDMNPQQHLVDVQFGKANDIVCLGNCNNFAGHTIDLDGGSIQPGLIAVGANLGLAELDIPLSSPEGDGAEASGVVPNDISDFTLRQAADVVTFGQKKLFRALRSGFTYSVTAPNFDATSFIRGSSCLMRVGAKHSLEDGLPEEQVALHVKVDANPNGMAGGHLQLNTLRTLLLDSVESARDTELGIAMQAVRKGAMPLVVEVITADAMARLISLKEDVEEVSHTPMRMIFHGATEAWMLAQEIKNADISVIVAPVRSFPYSKAEARALPGVPLTHDTVISTLWKAGVRVGVGMRKDLPPFTSQAFSFRWDLYNAMSDTTADIPQEEWYKMTTTNLEDMFFDEETRRYLENDFVAVRAGHLMEFGGTSVVAFSSGSGVSVF